MRVGRRGQDVSGCGERSSEIWAQEGGGERVKQVMNNLISECFDDELICPFAGV
jgi:hypothetical protein